VLVVGVVDDCLLVYKINHAVKVILLADGKKNGIGVCAEFFAHVRQRIHEIRADAVHFVDEGDARNFVLGGLPPDGFRLRLDSGDAAKHRHRAVQHAHGTLDLGREIHVPRSINDIDAMGDSGERLV